MGDLNEHFEHIGGILGNFCSFSYIFSIMHNPVDKLEAQTGQMLAQLGQLKAQLAPMGWVRIKTKMGHLDA